MTAPPDDDPHPDDLRPHRPVREVVGLCGWVGGWVAGALLACGPGLLYYGFVLWELRRVSWTLPALDRGLIVAGAACALPPAGAVYAAVRLRRSRRACRTLIGVGAAAAVALGIVTAVAVGSLGADMGGWVGPLLAGSVTGLPALGGLTFCLTGLWGRRFLNLRAW